MDRFDAAWHINSNDRKRQHVTAVTFEMWLNHFVKFKSPGRCLLIFDGARSHLDAAIVDAAEAPDIMLLCLPSNTTHELQPLDKSVFRAFEHYWDEEVLNYCPKGKLPRADLDTF